MFSTRSRAAALGVVAAALVLTACAPPGQPGDPGVAASYQGNDVTNVEIDGIFQAWLDGTKAQDVANRRQILTIEVLRDDLLAKCEELGYPVALSTAEKYADQWIQFTGQQGEASEDMIHATQGILALYIVSNADPTLETVREISDKVAESVEVSPRSGAYSTDTLIASIQTAMQTAEDKGLGSQFSYVEFQNAVAFTDAERDWFERPSTSS